MMGRALKVGDVVRLNDNGLSLIKPEGWEEIKQAQRMTITHIDPESMTDDVPVYLIEVDQPLINEFWLDTSMVELAEAGG